MSALGPRMNGLALLFPGQGAQRVGMDARLRAGDAPLADTWFARASAAAGAPLGRLCAEGPPAALMRTEIAQPALFALSLALAEIAREVGLRPAAVAGHSLGECTAAVAAGALAPDDGLAFVVRRARLMARAQARHPGTMAAVVGLARADVEALCATVAPAGALCAANFNAPRQVVVSGDAASVDRLVELVDRRDGVRVLRLPVGAAFHSPRMRGVERELAGLATRLDWREPAVALASNASGRLIATGAAIQEALLAQIAAPVRWVACVEALVGAGCRHFLELGPGRVLAGLVRQIAPDADVASADSRAAIAEFARRRPQLVATA